MDLFVPDDIPDLIDLPEGTVSDFEAFAHNVLKFSVLSDMKIYTIDKILQTLLKYVHSGLEQGAQKSNNFTLNIEQFN